MLPRNPFAKAMLFLSASLMISCSSPDSGAGHNQSALRSDDEKVLNLYIWSDFSQILRILTRH